MLVAIDWWAVFVAELGVDEEIVELFEKFGEEGQGRVLGCRAAGSGWLELVFAALFAHFP